MATSGQVIGNNLGQGKYAFVNWQLAGQEVGNNRSLINWQAYAHFTNSDSQLDNGGVGSAQVGMVWQNGGRVKNYEGNLSTRDVHLASGSFWVGHNNDGSQSLEMSVGIDYYQAGRSSASGWFALPTIPRNAVMTAHQGSFNDESNPWVEFSNPGGFQVNVRFEIGGQTVAQRNNVGSRYNWTLSTAERNQLRTLTKNMKSQNIRTVVATVRGGGEASWDYRDNTFTVINANPQYTNFTYKDKNPTTVAVTGNDQYFIQGQSELELTIDDADQAVPLKLADMVKYNASISSISQDIPFSTSDIVQSLGVLGVNSDTPLIVKAIDTRGYETAVSKTLKVLPYVVPQVTATARRVNNFETSTNIHIEGVVSRLTVDGVDKNAVNATNGVQYRYKKTTDTTWSAWTNRSSSLSSGNVSSPDFAINLDRNFAWNVEFRITDKVNSSTFATIVSVGIPIFRIGLDGFVYNNEVKMATLDDILKSNPYKFSVWRNSTQAGNDGATIQVMFNSETYDTNNNYDPATGVWTVPVTGYYFLSGSVRIKTNNAGSGGSKWLWDAMASMVKNNTAVIDQAKHYVYQDGRVTIFDAKFGKLHYLTAGDTIKVQAQADTNEGSQWVIEASEFVTFWSGFLVART